MDLTSWVTFSVTHFHYLSLSVGRLLWFRCWFIFLLFQLPLYSFYVDIWILCENKLKHPEAAISNWVSQGLLHFFYSHISGFILCIRHHYIFEAKIQSFNKNSQIPFSVFYMIVTPMINPIIYYLRNKDVMVALRKFLLKWIVLWLNIIISNNLFLIYHRSYTLIFIFVQFCSSCKFFHFFSHMFNPWDWHNHHFLPRKSYMCVHAHTHISFPALSSDL